MIKLKDISSAFLFIDGVEYISKHQVLDDIKTLKYLLWLLNAKGTKTLEKVNVLFVCFTRTQLNIALKVGKLLENSSILILSNSMAEKMGMESIGKSEKLIKPEETLTKQDVFSTVMHFHKEKNKYLTKNEQINRIYLSGRRRLIYLLLVKKILEKIFSKASPRVVVLPEDRSDVAILIAKEAREKGIKVVTFQHGFYSKKSLTKWYEIAPPSSDLYLVFGDVFKHAMEKAGVNPEIIKVTGNPLYDKFARINPKKHKSRRAIVLFASQPHPERGRVLRILKTAVKKRKDILLIDKLHPAEQFITHKAVHYMTFFNTKNVKIIPKGYIEQHIADCDVFTTISSTSFLGAIALNKPVIFLGESPISLEKYPVGVEVNSAKDFMQVIAGVNALKESVKKYRTKLIRDYLYNVDGKAAERMAGEIVKFCQE